MKKRRTYPTEFKKEAIDLVQQLVFVIFQLWIKNESVWVDFAT
jgi:hypothetical protein